MRSRPAEYGAPTGQAGGSLAGPWLAVDTATDTASIAIQQDDRLLAEESWTTRRRHTVQLAPRVARMLDEHELPPSSLSGIAVAIGPGSYTGLRIGLSLAKGMALGAGIDVVGVPTLDVLAAAFSSPALTARPRLWAVLRAGRGRVVAAAYPEIGSGSVAQRDGAERAHGAAGATGSADSTPPAVGGPSAQLGWPDPAALDVWTVEQLMARVGSGEWVAGEIDRELRLALERAGCFVPPPESSVRRAGWLARLGRERSEDPERPSLDDIAPVYSG
jgi:tRNA threonylcarbamoyladenosine biosynthesis protein TsaB